MSLTPLAADMKKLKNWNSEKLLTSLALVVLLELSTSSNALAQAWTWNQDFDASTEPVTTEQLDLWEQQANEGDMKLQRQFAEAFFENRFVYPGNCSHLKNGHRCRAMLTRLSVGEKFARQTAELLPPDNDKTERQDIAYFQRWYGRKRYSDAARVFDPASEACKDAVRFTTLAVENGENCAANLLKEMARWGRCMSKNDELGYRYARIASGCSVF